MQASPAKRRTSELKQRFAEAPARDRGLPVARALSAECGEDDSEHGQVLPNLYLAKPAMQKTNDRAFGKAGN